MDKRLRNVNALLGTMPGVNEDPEREAHFALEGIAWDDPATLDWAAACLVAHAATLRVGEDATAVL